MRFVMAEGLQIYSRHNASENMEASWTCCRTLDRTCVQLDYILANFRLQTVEVWNDFAYPIGLDHRCAHCILYGFNVLVPHVFDNKKPQTVATNFGF